MTTFPRRSFSDVDSEPCRWHFDTFDPTRRCRRIFHIRIGQGAHLPRAYSSQVCRTLSLCISNPVIVSAGGIAAGMPAFQSKALKLPNTCRVGGIASRESSVPVVGPLTTASAGEPGTLRSKDVPPALAIGRRDMCLTFGSLTFNYAGMDLINCHAL